MAIQTRSGAAWYPLDPRAEDVRAIDIAWSLSRVCRFGGHCSRTYTVLEHLVRCCDLALHSAGISDFLHDAPSSLHEVHRGALRHALLCLVHDAAEAYICDLPRPLKVQLAEYAPIEAKNDLACQVALAFGAMLTEHAAVKRVDNLMLSAEKDQLTLSQADGGLDWGSMPEWPRCSATDLSLPYWLMEEQGEEDMQGRDGATKAARAALLRMQESGLPSDEFAPRAGAWAEAVAELASLPLRQAWLRRLAALRSLCGLPVLP